MIYIDLSGFSPPQKWIEEAVELTAQLASKPTDAERRTFIDTKSKHWSNLKNSLPLNDKCWISESLNVVSDLHIEHFRPKKEVKKISSKYPNIQEAIRTGWSTADKVVGYWWLSFDWRNFRISGSKINTAKDNFFPLNPSTPTIAYGPADSIELELPLLLDPIVQGDPELLTFEPNGFVSPIIDNPTDLRHTRASISIDVYGLNNIPALIKARQTKWSNLIKAIDRANKAYNKMMQTIDDETLFRYLYNDFRDIVDNDIKPALSPQSEYSAVAKACFSSYQYEWIDEYF